MEETMKTFRLSLLILMGAMTLAGCGRKNLPVAPQSVTTPVGQAPTPNARASSDSALRFQRTGRISPQADLTVTPAEVTRNPQAAKKSFPLDFLLN